MKYIAEIQKTLRNDFKNALDQTIIINFSSSPEILTEEAMRQTIIDNFEKEKILGYSLEGCQKDDFEIMIDNISLKNNASQGETWFVCYLFFLAQHSILKVNIKSRLNLVLLDDIFISLDSSRQKKIISYIENEEQIIITTAKKTNIPKNIRANIINL
jgi:recombinational DNA repair ATPase RecF